MRNVLVALFFVALPLLAQTRSRASVPPRPEGLSGNTVAGIVSSVQGPFVLLANGLVTIDTTGAKIVGEGDSGSAPIIAPGSLVFAVLKSGNVAQNAPLPAQYIGVTKLPQASLTGTVTSIDLPNSTLTLLGRTIKVTPQTAISGYLMTLRALNLADVQTNMLVAVDTNAAGGNLVATSIHILAPIPPLSTSLLHGTVKSIGNDAWVITANGKDVTVVVNGQTKIAGDPKVGDTVEVVTTTDSANNTIAVVIIKNASITPPSAQLHFIGIVKAISATSWSIWPGLLLPDVKVQIDQQTKIIGNPRVGDRVEVAVELQGSAFVARSITRLP